MRYTLLFSLFVVAKKGFHRMKKTTVHIFFLALAVLTGCGKKKEETRPVLDRDEHAANIHTAFNNRDFAKTEHLIARFITEHPQDTHVASFKLMLADLKYEKGEFPASYEAYQHFQEYFPADPRADYAAYKAAHARFNQANHIHCDSSAVEATISLCRNYKSHDGYTKYRDQMNDLEQTCQRHLLEKELYTVNSYLNENRLASAKHRLKAIRKNFDLTDGGNDMVLFYEAKLAKTEGDADGLSRLVEDLHEAYPRSQFTAMAHRLAA